MRTPVEDKTTLVMVSCEERVEERERTLAQLAAAGLPTPWVALNECNRKTPANHKKQLANSMRCVHHAIEAGGHMLFLEDDIDCKPALLTWLRIAEYQDHMVTFTVLTGQSEPSEMDAYRSGGLVPPGLYRMPLKRWYGTQALFIPRHHLQPLATFVETGEYADTAFDSNVLFYAKRFNVPILAAYPNPVQHRSPYKIVNLTNGRPDHSKRTSWSFDRLPNKPIQKLLDVRRMAWRERTARLTSP